MIAPVRIRKNVFMYPVGNIPLTNTHDCQTSGKFLSRAVFKDSLIDWMVAQGLPEDSMSNEWNVREDWISRTSNFFFADPQIAMRFKLAWA